MTTIIWMPGMLIADCRCIPDRGPIRRLQKTSRIIKDGRTTAVLGSAGEDSYILAVEDWYRNGKQAPYPLPQTELDECEMLVMKQDGGHELYSKSPHPVTYEEPYLAIGSGAPYAVGALAMGATPAAAMTVASHFNSGTGDGMDWYYLEPTGLIFHQHYDAYGLVSKNGKFIAQ